MGTDPLKDALHIYKHDMTVNYLNPLKKEQDENKKRKVPKKKLKAKTKDPFDHYGHGIKSYFRTMHILMLTFSLLTIVFMPVMYRYHQGGMFNYLGDFLLSVSMGNLGETGPKC